MFWAATVLRERVGADYDAVYYSAIQRVFQLVAFKARMEALATRPVSAEEVAREFNARVQVSSGEAVSATFIDTAVTVHDRILRDVDCRDAVLWALGLFSRSHVDWCPKAV